MINAAGHFKQTKIGAYGEALINILLSVALVFKYGLVGVSAATLLAMIFRFIYYGIYLAKNVIYRKLSLFIKRSMINMSGVIIIFIVGNILNGFMNVSNYFEWIILAGIVFVFAGLIIFFINWCFYRQEVRSIIDRVIGKGISKLGKKV